LWLILVTGASGEDLQAIGTLSVGGVTANPVPVFATSYGGLLPPGSPRASLSEVSLTKLVDASSPLLLRALVRGEPLKEARLDLFGAGSTKSPGLRIRLLHVIVGAVDVGSSPDPRTILEDVRLSFGRIELTFLGEGGPVATCWDVVSNAEC
jgi:type VI protein secretion system component Hcp